MAKKKGEKKPQAKASSAPKEEAKTQVEADEPDAAGEGEANEAGDSTDAEDVAAPKADGPQADGPKAEAEEKAAARTRKPEREMAAWAKPIVTIDKWWTWFEERLLVVVVLGLMTAMAFWVLLKGLQEPVEAQSNAGVVLRGMVGVIALGPGLWLLSGRLGWPVARRRIVAVAGVLVGALVAPLWRDKGVEYFGHVFNWLQEGSSLTMFGQLRGVSTRLTVLLAMIGASLAAASGKHINIDAFLRFVPKGLKLPSFIGASLATVAVCLVAAWGFFDNIAVTNFGAPRDSTASEKIDLVEKHVSQDLFLWRQQVKFDFEALPIVLGGGRWDDEKRLNGKQWNEFVEESGYRDHFTKEQVDAILASPSGLDDSRLPMVIVPDGSPRGLLVFTMNLMFPIGLVLVGIRFFLRMLLVLGGKEDLDPDVEFLEPEGTPGKAHHDASPKNEEAAS
jgi:TRAP-type C4-dicarboxylate transport system permease small subunit